MAYTIPANHLNRKDRRALRKQGGTPNIIWPNFPSELLFNLFLRAGIVKAP